MMPLEKLLMQYSPAVGNHLDFVLVLYRHVSEQYTVYVCAYQVYIVTFEQCSFIFVLVM